MISAPCPSTESDHAIFCTHGNVPNSRQVAKSTYLELLMLLLAEVVLDVELGEEDEKHDGVGAYVVGKLPGEVAVVVENKLEAVRHDADKLDHLERGHVLLPPDVLLVFRAHGGDHVIEVHEDVDERVEKTEERRVTAGDEPKMHKP